MYKRRYRRRGNPLRKAARVAGKARARTRPAKMANVEALAKSVRRIKTQMRKDIEVKEYTAAIANNQDLLVGQVDHNLTGTDVELLKTLEMAAGTSFSQRVGNKVKLIGMNFRMFIQQQSGAGTTGSKVIIDLWKTTDFGYSQGQAVDLLYDADSISGVVDGNSSLNRDNMKTKANPNGLFQLIKRKVVYMPRDYVSGATSHKDVKFFVKQSQMCHFAGDALQSPNNVRYFIVIRATAGNRSTTTQSTLSNVPITSTNTGFIIKSRNTQYYTDA